jgi:hypothetical protein
MVWRALKTNFIIFLTMSHLSAFLLFLMLYPSFHCHHVVDHYDPIADALPLLIKLIALIISGHLI